MRIRYLVEDMKGRDLYDDNIKIDVCWQVVDCIHLAQHRVQSPALVNSVVAFIKSKEYLEYLNCF
jgi:hypothetical protein